MGAGKSVWGSLLADIYIQNGYPVTHVSEDDFLQPREYRDKLPSHRFENHENWLRLDLMKQVISNLLISKQVEYFPYLRNTGDLDLKKKIIKPADTIIFESSIFNEMFDVVILIEVKSDVLLSRKLKRDNTLRDKQTIQKYHTIQWGFWNKYKPSEPNYIINNNDYENPSLEIM